MYAVDRHINPTANHQLEMLSFRTKLQDESDDRHRSQQFDAKYFEMSASITASVNKTIFMRDEVITSLLK